MSILGQSATASTDAAVKRSLTSQFVVSNVVGTPFSTSVARQIRKVDGVRSVAEFRTAGGEVKGDRAFLGAVDARSLGLAVALPVSRARCSRCGPAPSPSTSSPPSVVASSSATRCP